MLNKQFAAISTVSQVAYLHIARPAVARLLGHGPDGPPEQMIKDFAQHAADFALAALRVPAGSGDSSPDGAT